MTHALSVDTVAMKGMSTARDLLCTDPVVATLDPLRGIGEVTTRDSEQGATDRWDREPAWRL